MRIKNAPFAIKTIMDENQTENPVAPVATPEESQETSAPSQEKDPVEAELERVEQKPKRSKREQLEYTRKRVDQQIAELDKAEGVTHDDDSRPLTVGDLRKMREEESIESALNLAESLSNEHERRLTKHYLENNLRSTGNAQEDFRLAYAMVTAVKNGQLAEEAVRAQKVRTTTSAPSAPAKVPTSNELTREETELMTAFNLTKDEVLAARPK